MSDYKEMTVARARRKWGDAAVELILGDMAENKSQYFRIGLHMYHMVD